jgi:calcineurin-like phosphoesterase family protein
MGDFMKVYLISDTHFGQENICSFLKDDGSKVRPWDNVKDMDEALIQNWNDIVKPEDKIYHLGDVVFHKKDLVILEKLNGHKVLIRGNHDIFDLKEYAKYFKDIRGSHKLDKYLLSHIPIHPDSLARWCGGNIHGHLHSNKIMDNRYLNVCVEWTDFKPILLEEAFYRLEKQKIS